MACIISVVAGPAAAPATPSSTSSAPARGQLSVYQDMLRRCNNPNNPAFSYYGARGIEVCARWQNSFENFFADMGQRPTPELSLERLDNDGPYSPENCTWATRQQQQRNRRGLRLLTHDGETLCIAEWSERSGIPQETFRSRITKCGWSVARALSEPVHRHNPKAVDFK